MIPEIFQLIGKNAYFVYLVSTTKIRRSAKNIQFDIHNCIGYKRHVFT